MHALLLSLILWRKQALTQTACACSGSEVDVALAAFEHLDAFAALLSECTAVPPIV